MISFEDFATSLQHTQDREQALALLLETIAGLGFRSYDYGYGTAKVPRPRVALDLDFLGMEANTDWERRYLTCGYMAVDRTTPISLSQTSPHLYGDLLWKDYDSPLQAQMEDDLHQKGIFSGVSIPMHTVDRRFGIMNLGSSLSVAEFARLDATTRPVVSLIAHIFHDHTMRLDWPTRSPPLSARELECLHWAAQGKTAWEIGEILTISERTAKKHLGAAVMRLGCTTRTQAVARAIARGIIAL